MKYYLDSSFLVEIIKGESRGLSIFTKLEGDLYSSQLGRTETLRTLIRFYPEWVTRASSFIEGINLIDIDNAVLRNVERYGANITLKTADAIHLSTAHLLIKDEGSLVTFDKQMATNAKKLGLKVITA